MRFAGMLTMTTCMLITSCSRSARVRAWHSSQCHRPNRFMSVPVSLPIGGHRRRGWRQPFLAHKGKGSLNQRGVFDKRRFTLRLTVWNQESVWIASFVLLNFSRQGCNPLVVLIRKASQPVLQAARNYGKVRISVHGRRSCACVCRLHYGLVKFSPQVNSTCCYQWAFRPHWLLPSNTSCSQL